MSGREHHRAVTFSSQEHYISARELGRRSSIGNVKTLRSQLHTRRTALNEEIEKENQFVKGSKKLVGATLDHKIRDQASLEMSFAESKVKALQSELSKINSSLNAYQDESIQDTQIPLIPLACKTTAKVNFVIPLSDIISKHYHSDPSSLEDSMYDLQELRYSVSSVSRDDAGIEVLFEYYTQIQLVAKRFLHSKLKHGIAFIWYDAINGLPSAQQSAVFEKACVLFNIGALYTQLAAKVNRSTAEAIDTAMQYLEKAIGILEYMKEKFSHSPSLDMSKELLAMFSDLMRAQAQELVWEKVVLGGLKGNVESLIDYSHLTKSVAECYRPVKELVDDENIKEYLPESWVTLVKVKDAHYKGQAHYYAALVHAHLAKTYADGGILPEELRTEVHFLYTNIENNPEVLTNHPKFHFGLMQSHLNCASLSHEYAVKYSSFCRDLHHITPLTRMLAEAEEETRSKKEEADKMQGVTIIAPTIQPAEIKLAAVFPDFKSVSEKVKDLFRALGPMPAFSGENSWSAPRSVTVKREKGSFGLSIRGSRPVRISEIDEGGAAESVGVKVNDWLLSVNGINVMYRNHETVVGLVKDCDQEVTFELTTPDTATAQPERNSTEP